MTEVRPVFNMGVGYSKTDLDKKQKNLILAIKKKIKAKAILAEETIYRPPPDLDELIAILEDGIRCSKKKKPLPDLLDELANREATYFMKSTWTEEGAQKYM